MCKYWSFQWNVTAAEFTRWMTVKIVQKKEKMLREYIQFTLFEFRLIMWFGKTVNRIQYIESVPFKTWIETRLKRNQLIQYETNSLEYIYTCDHGTVMTIEIMQLKCCVRSLLASFLQFQKLKTNAWKIENRKWIEDSFSSKFKLFQPFCLCCARKKVCWSSKFYFNWIELNFYFEMKKSYTIFSSLFNRIDWRLKCLTFIFWCGIRWNAQNDNGRSIADADVHIFGKLPFFSSTIDFVNHNFFSSGV